MLSACSPISSPENSPATQDQPAISQTGGKGKSLDIVVQKVLPKTGFRLLLVVTDENGRYVRYSGNVNANIWIQTKGSDGKWVVPAKKEKMIYEWTDIELTQEGYMKYEGEDVIAEGIPLVLEWGEFHLISDQGINIEEEALCTIGTTLTLDDGTVLTAEETDINILMRFTCC
jgi:hypothetical protein